mgnify:CR=1 FL=1
MKKEELDEEKRDWFKVKKNILIIDDSALMRRVLSDIINEDPRYEVTGLAVNGLEGLDRLIKEKYDAVVLDINMPKMNGLELMEQIRKHKIKAKVIIVSTVAKDGAYETIRALELGAFDFITKPESFYETKSASFRTKLINTIAYATNTHSVVTSELISSTIQKKSTAKPLKKVLENTSSTAVKSNRKSTSKKKLIALACSTGGPKALQSVIPQLPKNLDAPILIVQHMPAGFTGSLAVRLNEMSELSVKEAQDGDILESGNVYIAKGGNHMRVHKSGSRAKISIDSDEPRSGLRPCADYMYESLTDSVYDEIICVVLTGMGSDGTKGITKLKESKNIYVIAQDMETSTVYGMPKAIAVSGLTDEVLPLVKIKDAITRYVGVL